MLVRMMMKLWSLKADEIIGRLLMHSTTCDEVQEKTVCDITEEKRKVCV